MATVYTSIYAGPGSIGYGESGSRKEWVGNIVYTSVTYGANGLAVAAGSLGFVARIESLEVLSAGPATTDLYKWDQPNGTIRRYVQDGTTKLYGETSGSQTVTVYVRVLGY